MAKKPRNKKQSKAASFKRNTLFGPVSMTKHQASAWDVAYKRGYESQRFCGGSTIKGVKSWGLSTPKSLLSTDLAHLCTQTIISELRNEGRDWQLWVGIYTEVNGDVGCSHEVVTVSNVTSITLSDQINMLIKHRVEEWDKDNEEQARGYAWVAIPTDAYDLEASSEKFVTHFIDNHDITNEETRNRLAEIWRIENQSRGDIDTSSLVLKEEAA